MTAAWLPGGVFLDSAESDAVEDLNPPPPPPNRDPWAAKEPRTQLTLAEVTAVYVDWVEVRRVREGWPVPRLQEAMAKPDRYAHALALIDAGLSQPKVAAAMGLADREVKRIVEWRRERTAALSLGVAS